MTDRLQIASDGDRALRFTRRFDAPRPLLWRALTEAPLLPRWLWARDHPMTLCEQDFRIGGGFRWGWAMPGGGTMAVSGRFLEIVAPRRMIHTELFDDDWTGGETTVTTELDEVGAATLMQMQVLYSSRAARDGAAATPMAEGMAEAYDRLDGLLPGWA